MKEEEQTGKMLPPTPSTTGKSDSYQRTGSKVSQFNFEQLPTELNEERDRNSRLRTEWTSVDLRCAETVKRNNPSFDWTVIRRRRRQYESMLVIED